jgi:hypothetical protein
MTLTLTDLLDYIETCCGDPEVREVLSQRPEQARAIAELVAFTRKRQGCTPGPIERQLFEDAAAHGPEYFNAFLNRVIGNPGRATEAQLRAVIRTTVLGKPLFEMPQPVALLPDDYARHLQADEP